MRWRKSAKCESTCFTNLFSAVSVDSKFRRTGTK